MKTLELEKLLHPRIVSHCKKLYDDGHYKHASQEALSQVERALKEKSGLLTKKYYGVNLIDKLFGKKKEGIKLFVEFGEDIQEDAQKYLRGVFSYYRNYTVHDGSKIDELHCIKIMILASDLMELIGVSTISITEVGGYEELVEIKLFPSDIKIAELLQFMDGYTIPDETYDGFFEALAWGGFSEEQYISTFDYGLVEYTEEQYSPSEWERKRDPYPTEIIGWFELTDLGKSILREIEG